MTSEDLVLVDRRADGVAVITLNRGSMNPLSNALLDAITVAAQALAADSSVKAVVLTGSDRAFAAGADVKEFEVTDAGARAVADKFRAACDALGSIPRPVIAAISGFALGGGLEIALACDLRIASESARVGQPEILLGIIPGGGGTQRLARLIGPSRAKELIWTGRQVRADEALALGIVNEVVPADQLLARALDLASELAAGAVMAMGYAKRAIDEGIDASLDDGLDLEADCFAASFETSDAELGIASFIESGPGKATFTGR